MRRYIAILALRLRSLLRKQAVERDLERELRLHFDELVAEYLKEGLSREEAERSAKRSMGGLAQITEECRDQRRTRFADRAIGDVKYSLRVLRKHPIFTLSAVASLALGIGANTLMFSIVEAILLRPLPYRNPAQLFSITETSQRMPAGVVLPPEFANWLADNHTFSALAAWNDEAFTLTGSGEPLHISAATVNAGFFRTFEVTPTLGRAFLLSEDGSNPERVVILSDHLWKTSFSADPQILGRIIVLNSLGYRVVGVLSSGFRFPDNGQPDLYLPGGFSGPSEWNRPRMALLHIAGRLPTQAAMPQAKRELERINRRHSAEIPGAYRRAFEGRVFEILPLHDKIVGNVRPALLVLWAAVGLLLVLTCSNLAALQLARAFARSGEFAIRLALGGDRKRVLALLLTENLLLASVGSAIGVAGAYALIPAVRPVNALHLASPSDLRIDSGVLLAALALTMGSTLLFGLGPAIAASLMNPQQAMKAGSNAIAGGTWGDRARSGLVSIQIALALILVVGAGLLLKSAANILRNPLGMQPANLTTALFRIDPLRYATEDRLADLGGQIVSTIRQIPGVESAALTNALPFDRYSLGAAIVFEGRPAPPPGARPSVPVIAITPGYFHTLEEPVLAGRGVEDRDRRNSARVAVVNYSFAMHFFPGADPIGRRFRWGADGAPWTEIVGIAADVRHRSQDTDPEPEIFVPFEQAPGNYVGLAVRSALPLETLAPAIRSEFRRADPNLAVFNIVTMEKRISDTLKPRRIGLLVIGTFSMLAFFLAVTGVYGVINYVVSRRTREFGIRLALGAWPSQVTAQVMRRAVLLAVAGLVPGLALSYCAARSLSSLLYKVRPEDVESYAVAAILLFAAVIIASFIPARRASQTDPLKALRWE